MGVFEVSAERFVKYMGILLSYSEPREAYGIVISSYEADALSRLVFPASVLARNYFLDIGLDLSAETTTVSMLYDMVVKGVFPPLVKKFKSVRDFLCLEEKIGENTYYRTASLSQILNKETPFESRIIALAWRLSELRYLKLNTDPRLKNFRETTEKYFLPFSKSCRKAFYDELVKELEGDV